MENKVKGLNMLKHSRNIVGIAALVLVGLVGSTAPARASSFVFQWIDTDDAVGLRGVTYQDGVVIQDVNVGPEDYFLFYGLWPDGISNTLTSSFDLRFNIYDADGVTLSDTWEIQGNQGDSRFFTPFHSDTEGVPLAPLPDATSLIETGGFQTVFEFDVSNDDHYTLQFVSDEERVVPEPATLLLFGTSLGMGALRRRLKRQA